MNSSAILKNTIHPTSAFGFQLLIITIQICSGILLREIDLLSFLVARTIRLYMLLYYAIFSSCTHFFLSDSSALLPSCPNNYCLKYIYAIGPQAQSFSSVMTPECCQKVYLLDDGHTSLQISETTSYSSFQPSLSITDFMHIIVSPKRSRYLGFWKNLPFLLSQHFQDCSIFPSSDSCFCCEISRCFMGFNPN